MLLSLFLSSVLLTWDTATAFTLPFPWPCCTSTTTFTLSGGYTVTRTETVTTISIDTVSTTSYVPTAINCLPTATTIKPYPFGIPLEERDAASAAGIGCSPITIIPPSITGFPCTEVVGSFDIVTDTETITTSGIATQTITPTIVETVTETWILPTPSIYRGVNYYQYLNDYFYPDGDKGCRTCGYGGGGYETSDWNGNYSYYTNGTTQQINFESENYPSYSTILCQLPSQAAATDCSQWTVVFQGYLHATQTGNYTVAPYLGEDNALFFWGGEKAYRSYANNNTDGGVSYTQPAGLPHTFSYEMVAGEFLPITFIYANGYGPALNRLTITSPNGTTYPQDLGFFVPPCPDSPFVP
ncbi:conserved hypothetical protein [Talaromyces stipitatus ATCC 10500]|uniref:PA14 domain-containing protein n=1 Tax=Talaromyces stipitatus (strain ATCC 10500 / CBS 375.48 / QM 6759 / NRRL 1006) TaxID=441959 RepID=B8MKN9_TALSN|nr:uncharacterized protein TSTA_043590 [Talaromyces stipitatus ATCC 10500]EED14888.1 conserved hypothetical protein [Talaromyces stipitatus ATCC 10500]